MAKKESKEFSIDSLRGELKKVNPFSGSIAENIVHISEYIDSGNYMLNALLSGSIRGGYPNNRSIQLGGDSGTGKTIFSLISAKAAQDLGYHIFYYDTEGAVDRDMILQFGLDENKFEHHPTSDLGKFRNSVTTIVKKVSDAKAAGVEVPKIAVYLDSLGMLASEKEVTDALSGNAAADMTRAKIIRSVFRIITSDMATCGIPFIFTNHTLEGIGMFAQKTTSGGGGQIYSPSIIVMMTKAQLKDDKGEKKVRGIVANVRCTKNRFSIPYTVKIHIDWKMGINKFIGLQEFIDWETCGIQKGNILTQKEFDKLKDGEKKKAHKFIDESGADVYFSPKDTALKYICKHLGRAISTSELFSDVVFTEAVLTDVDEKKIKPLLSYSSALSETEHALEVMMSDEDDDEDDE